MRKHAGFSRRVFLGVSGSALASSLTPQTEHTKKPENRPTRPNLIFFMPDEMRAESISCYGNPIVQTPNLDQLSSQGVRFSQCFAQNPVCGPSRCSLMTGWPVHVHGHRSLYYFLRPNEPNLFRYLRQGGYDVYWFGKNDILACASFADSVTKWQTANGSAEEKVRNPWSFNDPHYYSFLFEEGDEPENYSDYANVTAAVRILESRESKKPCCIFLPLDFPHPPYSAPKGFHNMYHPDQVPPLRPIGRSRKPNFHDGIRKSYRLDELSDNDFRKIQAVYLGMISYTDWLLGRLLEGVGKTGHNENTFIFVFSDHGDYAGDYGLVEKWPSGLEDVLTKVPLIVWGPGVMQEHVSEEIVELYDVMPTCLELANVEPQHTHFARSLMPQLRGERGDVNRAAFCEGGYNTYEPQCFEPLLTPPTTIYYPKTELEIDHPEMVRRAAMVRTQNYKLILRPGGESELYDLKRDPREINNLYGEQDYRSMQLEMHTRMIDWYILTADAAPRDKDPRELPPFYETPKFSSEGK